jgi:tetratricopeptide (TPR) repeat protein
VAGYRAVRFPGARRVLAQDAVDRYDLRRTLMARMLNEHPTLSLLLLVGDVEMDELDLDPRAGSDLPGAALNRQEPDVHGLVIAGNLLVHGSIHHVRSPIGLSLYILGSLRAQNVSLSGLELVVRDSVDVKDTFVGSGPHGGARLDGGVAAKLLISDGFPMLIGGRLAAPVLETGRTRIGLVEGGNVREHAGDVPPGLVLDESVLDGPPPEGRFSFARAQARLGARASLLSADFLSGRTNLDAIRELRWLEGEIESAMAGGRWMIAAELLRAARQRGARDVETTLQMAEALFRMHQPTGDREGLTEALALLDEAMGRDPEPTLIAQHSNSLVTRAAILMQLYENDDAAFELAWQDCGRAAVTLPPEHRAGIASLMGQWLFARRRYADCVPYLRQALLVTDDDGAIHGSLARALWMLDREGEAVEHATRSLELNPSDDRMWFVRGKCYQVLGDVGQARFDLQTYLELHSDDELTVEALVEIALDQGHVELAVDRARQFVAAHPDFDDAPARLGRLLHGRGLHEWAVPFLRRAVELDPGHRSTVVDLALALSERPGDMGGLTTALRVAEMEFDEEHLQYLRGEIFFALGDTERAAEELTRYVAKFPDAARALATLATLESRRGRREEVTQRLAAAKAVAPDDAYVAAVTQRLEVVR